MGVLSVEMAVVSLWDRSGGEYVQQVKEDEREPRGRGWCGPGPRCVSAAACVEWVSVWVWVCE